MKSLNTINPSKRDGQDGFTLIEVLIAIVILSVGLLGMASLTVGIIKGNKFSNDLSTATTLAQDKMEFIRSTASTDYASVASETKAACPGLYRISERGNSCGGQPGFRHENGDRQGILGAFRCP